MFSYHYDDEKDSTAQILMKIAEEDSQLELKEDEEFESSGRIDPVILQNRPDASSFSYDEPQDDDSDWVKDFDAESTTVITDPVSWTLNVTIPQIVTTPIETSEVTEENPTPQLR